MLHELDEMCELKKLIWLLFYEMSELQYSELHMQWVLSLQIETVAPMLLKPEQIKTLAFTL